MPIDRREQRDRIFLTIATILLPIVLGIAVGLLLNLALTESPAALPPCPTEDSDNCFWQSTVAGNGMGRSFLSINGFTIYLSE